MTTAIAAPDAAAQISGLIFAVLLIDERNRIVEANSAAEEMLGCSSGKLFDKPVLEILGLKNDLVAESVEKGLSRLIVRGLTIQSARSEKRVNLTSSPLDAHPGWRVMTLSDVGQNSQHIEDDERSEVRTPAILAHEIKNPLSAIRGAAQLLSRRLNDRDKALTQLISAEVDRIAALLDRMQQLGAEAALEIGPCNLHQSVRNAMAVVRASRPDACELIEEFDPSLPPVAADSGALEQVLINLIGNACDACDEADHAHVVIKTRYASGLVLNAIRLGKPMKLPIEVTVTDPGPGVEPAIRNSIFEPFVSSKPQGQGLGLALVKKLMCDMGGRVVHERDERRGLTHFRLNLPLAS